MKLRRICFLLAGLLVLSGCAQRPSAANNPLKDIDPAKGFYEFGSFNGETTVWRGIYGTAKEQEILEALAAVPAAEAKDWTPELVELPLYGLVGEDLSAAWSNGYWITGEGKAYQFDYDFAALAESVPWDWQDKGASMALFPCADLICRQGDHWRADLLPPAPPLAPAEGITLTVTGWEDMVLHTQLRNDTGERYLYGEVFRLQVFLEDAWRDVPAGNGDLGFNSIGYPLPAGAVEEVSWNCSSYYSEDLPAGQYRILICDDISAEFTI